MRGLIWILATAAFCASPQTPGFKLPDDVVPRHYQVTVSIDPDKETFDGTVRIQVDVVKPTATIWLNGKDLEVKSARLYQGDANRPVRARLVNKELIAIDATAPINGNWTIQLDYRGKLDEKAVLGAYRRKVDGNWYVYTTFTPIEARRAIPCFDEPRFKTPWEVSIKVPPGQKAFSNGPEVSQEPAPDGQTMVHFGATRPLPSELVAFAVGPFDIYQGEPAGHGTPVRVITPKGHAFEGRAAAEATVTVLPRLEEFTGIPYAFGKMDHLALADAAFGAVENPGLIVYLARELLMLPATDTVPRVHALRLLEAHEIGHQWFGDLVTQASWSDVWLSEGFATWVSEKVMDLDDRPERAHLSLIMERERIMLTDEARRTRPVRLEPFDREGTRDIYNRFVYDKGASVLLMLEGWLGADQVHDGVRAYLNEHRFGNATTGDLTAALKRASGVDPTAVMHSFLDIAGLPRVSVQIECAGTPRIRFRQNGALQNGAAAIPICYRGAGVARSCTVLDGPSREVELPKETGCPAWVEPNAGGTGYYRTTWTAAQLAALAWKDLSPAERLTLAYDMRSLPTDRAAARAMLSKLASDPEPEIARAAQDGLDTPGGRGPR